MTLIYDTETCSRCAGSGVHSYCQMHGDTCFKCRGKGRTYTKVSQASAAAVVALRRSLTEKHARDLVVGDVVRDRGTVSSVRHTDDACGWGAQGQVNARWVFVGFDGAEPERCSGCAVFHLRLTKEGTEAIRALARTLPGVDVRP